MFRKGKSAVKGNPKVGVGLKRRRVPSKRKLGWKSAWWGSTERKEASHFSRIEKNTPVLRSALQTKQSSLFGLHHDRDRGGGGPNGKIDSVKRAAGGRRQKNRKIIDGERKVQGQEGIPAEHIELLRI